ncbi:NEAT domain-containing protein [Mammaliicoccus sciuri]|uniref:NEAT domain-containing protein n=1 Tax=Mammaliicoccus sciuri TaxID=1296 RepID=UPI0021D2C1AD|nr:NEAT domain-containing protein [Mammaliicoccus sciuri]UXU84187.1 NEAT domain-containing protein [Mammaliicoccus sciuri]UXU94036.1 NEAT domain-containing protein [Mammaliicoccus sciuri]UXV15985.1 NEAT domain-containing protein [Mammaliicoccus sciuri]UXV24245.1 NEAT domain-containing protein [Mammaliicoccus sciuri]UXV27028.1 NEAT domain-containing protein [Mammaliicoccus sciuri]
MKKSVKSLLAFSLLFSTLSFNTYEPLSHTTMKKVEAAEEQASVVESKTIDFVVNKDKSNEVSYMDQYMMKPAKVYFENGETYVEMTLKSASYWKSFELYDESGAIEIQTVKEDHQADTKVIKFIVKPGSQSLTSKVHIVVPAINYDNKYTTHVNFKEVIPSAPTTQNSNQQDIGKVDKNDKAKDDSNQSTNDQKQDNTKQNVEDTQQAPAKNSNHEKPQTELPKQETSKNETPMNDNKPITKKEVPIPDKVKNPSGSNQGSTIQEKATSMLGYMVYKNGSSEISYMEQYMVKPARIIEENGKQYVEITLRSASYWKSFELFDHDKKLNVTTVSEDQSADTKIIRFEKPKDLKVLTSKVHIVVPAINYDNHYTTRIEFDKEAASGNVNTNTSDEQQQPVSTPSKDDDTKGHDSNNVQHNQTTPSDDQKSESSNASSGANSSTNHSSSLATPSNQAVTSGNNRASSTTADKANPSFDRNADGSTNMKLVNPSTSSSGDAMTYALIFSGAVLLLAGSFFLGKKRASK